MTIIKWARVNAGEYYSDPDCRFRIDAVYDRAAGGDVWRLTDASEVIQKPYYRDTMRECRELAENIVRKENGQIRTIKLTDDMF